MTQQNIFCSRCGQSIPAGGSFCQNCGTSLQPSAAPAADLSVGSAVPVVAVVNPYGGFWIRFVAYILDRIIVGILMAPVFIIFGLHMATQFHQIPPNDTVDIFPVFRFVWVIALIAVGVQWLYEALLTSSTWQATIGKRALGLKVTDELGNRISFERATGRYFAKFISNFTFCIGYIMAGFTARKQALHDMIAGTLVMKSDMVPSTSIPPAATPVQPS
jgi:uncharacterized RDD family membrane protein YckC